MSRLSGESTFQTRVGSPARDLHFVTFTLGEREYAIEVAEVCGIHHGLAVIPTPDEPEIFAGEIQLASERVPVVDLRLVLHLPERTGASWLLVVNHSGRMIGLLVDQVSEVIRVPSYAVTESANMNPGESVPGFVAATIRNGNRRIHVADLSRLIGECLPE